MGPHLDQPGRRLMLRYPTDNPLSSVERRNPLRGRLTPLGGGFRGASAIADGGAARDRHFAGQRLQARRGNRQIPHAELAKPPPPIPIDASRLLKTAD